MAYQDPRTWQSNDALSEPVLNEWIRDQQAGLKAESDAAAVLAAAAGVGVGGARIVTLTGTSQIQTTVDMFVAVPGVEVSVDVMSSGQVLCLLTAATSSESSARWSIIVDGVNQFDDVLGCSLAFGSTRTDQAFSSFIVPVDGLAAGSRAVSLGWRYGGGGGFRIRLDLAPLFFTVIPLR